MFGFGYTAAQVNWSDDPLRNVDLYLPIIDTNGSVLGIYAATSGADLASRKRLSIRDYAAACVDYLRGRRNRSGAVVTSADNASIVSAGATVVSTVAKAKITATGLRSTVVAVGRAPTVYAGDGATVVASADNASIVSAGALASVMSAGDNATIATAGQASACLASGTQSAVAAPGACSQVDVAGAGSVAATLGRNSSACGAAGTIAAALGNASVARGALGSWLVLAEWQDDVPVNVKAVQVDGEKIRADTWYKLDNGDFVVSDCHVIDDL